ncbi:hypothetical protein CA602_25950 [Paraburkholderia hospita]|nr:hypothetical protein CA602_25950 [Paraburkholderia hospita]
MTDKAADLQGLGLGSSPGPDPVMAGPDMLDCGCVLGGMPLASLPKNGLWSSAAINCSHDPMYGGSHGLLIIDLLVSVLRRSLDLGLKVLIPTQSSSVTAGR